MKLATELELTKFFLFLDTKSVRFAKIYIVSICWAECSQKWENLLKVEKRRKRKIEIGREN